MDIVHKRDFTRWSLIVLFLFLIVPGVYGELPSHLDRAKNPAGCSGCHSPHGVKGTPTLKASKDDFCYNCHGMKTLEGGVVAKTDMQSLFNKWSRHPVRDTAIYHIEGEDLPEKNPATPRHVACRDCHNVHRLTASEPWKGVSGYTREMIRGREATKEYEVCYKCHTDSANLPFGASNLRLLFDPANPSYHPVEAAGRNTDVPSLIRTMSVHDTIRCSDCHGNDDPFGPQGPHASAYSPILKARYERNEMPESPDAYALCYTCHDRRSILANESFRAHREHIVFNHVPCSACHTPHGSRINPDLVEFDETFTGTAPASYIPDVSGRPTCFLTCHVGGRDVVHDTSFYTGHGWQ